MKCVPMHFAIRKSINASQDRTCYLRHTRVINVTDKAARGLLVTNLVILNHGQVTKTTLELVTPPSTNFSTRPTGRQNSLGIPEARYHALLKLRNPKEPIDECCSQKPNKANGDGSCNIEMQPIDEDETLSGTLTSALQ
ncbi:hypothetical protein TNCV_3007951 [Trichonephila clavipes]|nr:hypothetical protein TNCV_3007951 [Trichonephila clavipes]